MTAMRICLLLLSLLLVQAMEHLEGEAYRYEEDMACGMEHNECSVISPGLICNGVFCQCQKGYEWIFSRRECKRHSCPPGPPFDCMVHDSSDCSGGWSLGLRGGKTHSFSGAVFSENWWQKNDIDRVGVRPGCLLTMWTEDNFAGLSLSFGSNSRNRWVILAEDPHYADMHENIESLKCDCSPSLGLPPRLGPTTARPRKMAAVSTTTRKTTTEATTRSGLETIIARDRARSGIRKMNRNSYDWKMPSGGGFTTTQSSLVNRRLCQGRWDETTHRCQGVMQCPSYCKFWRGTGECWLRTGWLGNPIRCGGE